MRVCERPISAKYQPSLRSDSALLGFHTQKNHAHRPRYRDSCTVCRQSTRTQYRHQSTAAMNRAGIASEKNAAASTHKTRLSLTILHLPSTLVLLPCVCTHCVSVQLLGWLWWLPCELACGDRSRAATHPACLVFSSSMSSWLPLVLSVGRYCLWHSRMNFKRLSPLFHTREVLRTCASKNKCLQHRHHSLFCLADVWHDAKPSSPYTSSQLKPKLRL